MLGVEKIERDSVDTARRELAGKLHHEVTHLICAGAVTKNQGDTDRARGGGRIEQGGHMV
jgi:hypothetical protein